jgi:rhodanese-related sulfurtransferase
MLISFGRKQKRVQRVLAGLSVPPDAGSGGDNQRQTCLLDLRSAAAFRSGFVPGSYSVPDPDSLIAAAEAGLFVHRSVYLLADSDEQLAMCAEDDCFGPTASMEGWFSADALDEWQMHKKDLGTLEAITRATLSVRMAAWNTVALRVLDNSLSVPGAPSDALTFRFPELRASLDGLPTESSLCVICRTNELASFASSLLWNFGFHKTTYLGVGSA